MSQSETTPVTPVIAANWVETIPSVWRPHRHVALWLCRVIKPTIIVDLGVDYGYSTFCFGQCLDKFNADSRVYGFDSYAGDEHTGYRNTWDTVQSHLKKYTLGNIVLPLPITFQDAAEEWDPTKKIQILHIDGAHTEEAVRRDIAAWLPHLDSENGVILIHAVATRALNFGAYRVFNEMQGDSPSAAAGGGDAAWWGNKFLGMYWELASGIGMLCRNRETIEHVHRDYHQSIHRGPVQFQLPITTIVPTVPVYGFYHICALHNFKDVVAEQLSVLYESGLYDRSIAIYISLTGPPDLDMEAIEHAKTMLAEFDKQRKFKIVYLSTDISVFERPILHFMHGVSHRFSQEPALFYYLHTKGVSQQHQKTANQNIAQWRQMMQFFVIEQWPKCMEALSTNSIAGVNWRTWPMPHFSGNFWWARSDYVASLPSRIGTEYYEPEAWIGSGKPRVHVCHQTEFDHYFTPYPRIKYSSVRDTIELLIRGILDVFNEFEIEHFITYGTLLGWRRENRVIAHDDDGDFIVSGTFYTRILGLKKEFEKRGMYLVSYGQPRDYRKILQVRTHAFQQVVDKDDCGFIDIYCSEPRETVIVDHWNFWTYLRSDVMPLKEVEFLDRKTYVPRNHDAILEVLYGEDFMTPKPGKKFAPKYVNGFANLYKTADDADTEKPPVATTI